MLVSCYSCKYSELQGRRTQKRDIHRQTRQTFTSRKTTFDQKVAEEKQCFERTTLLTFPLIGSIVVELIAHEPVPRYFLLIHTTISLYYTIEINFAALNFF